MTAGATRRRPAALSAAEAERLCQAVAADLRAEGFCLFAVATTAERHLLPLFGMGAGAWSWLQTFVAPIDGEVARHAVASSTPFWWDGSAPSDTARSLRHLPWAARIGAGGGMLSPGIGFPCSDGRESCGAAVFWGETIALAPERLTTIHARCTQLWSVARIESEGGKPVPRLSKRERECLRLSADGLTSEEIADRLGLSVHTANQYLATATGKLDAVNRIQALAKALRMGLID